MKCTNRQLLLGTLAAMLAGCSQHQEMPPLPEVVQVERVIPYHIVKEGETVGSIAVEHSMTRSELIKLNNLTPPYQLYNGQRLVINVKVDTSDVPDDLPTEQEKPPVPADTLNTQGMPENAETAPKEEPTEDKATIDEIQQPPESSTGSENLAAEYVWPIEDGQSKISQSFKDSQDGGVIMQSSAGTPVRAIADGIVRIARALDGEASSYGNTVIILHNGKNKLSVYSHLRTIKVKANQTVKCGDIIGEVGKTGTAKSPQLYFQLFDIKADKSRTPVDPGNVLP